MSLENPWGFRQTHAKSAAAYGRVSWTHRRIVKSALATLTTLSLPAVPDIRLCLSIGVITPRLIFQTGSTQLSQAKETQAVQNTRGVEQR